MDWKTMLAYVTGSVDENLLLRIEYLVAENRILRDQIKGRTLLLDSGVLCFDIFQGSNSFLSSLKNKGFKDDRIAKIGLYDITTPRPRNPTRASCRWALQL